MVAPTPAERSLLETAFTRADTVKPKNPLWLPTPMGSGWVAKTGPTILAGMQDLGKTGLALAIAAEVTRRGDAVLVFSAEDDPQTTLVPRLLAAEADLGHVYIFKEDRDFWLTESSTGILDAAVEQSRARLAIFDPLLAYFSSGTDSHRDRDVRAVIRRLNAVSLHRRVALLGVMHFNKGDHVEILHYISSSVAFTAAPRSVLAIVPSLDADDDSTVLIQAKCNVARKQPSRVLRKTTVSVANRVRTYKTEVGEVSELTAGNYVAKRREAEHPGHRRGETLEAAVRELHELLRDGPKTSRDVKAWMDANGHTWRTTNRAKERLGVRLTVDPDGQAGRDYLWNLPKLAERVKF